MDLEIKINPKYYFCSVIHVLYNNQRTPITLYLRFIRARRYFTILKFCISS